MKKLLFIFLMFFLIAGLASAQIARGGTAWVASKTLNLKSSTWFFATNRGTLNYGDEVSVLQINGKWAEVRSVRTSQTGWVDSSNLSARRIVVSSSTGGASASEMALAGKGFDQDIENSYRADGNLNYADVDITESIEISQEELLTFMREGRLFTGENR